jgi:uncharacterized protein YqhQ
MPGMTQPGKGAQFLQASGAEGKMADIGGQAVIEGVMMRSGDLWSVAVRTPENEIVVKNNRIRKLPRVLKLPLIRGVVALIQALSLGISALLYSAEVSGHEEEKPSSLALTMTVLVAFVIGILLFLLLPLYATKLLGIFYGGINNSSLIFNLVDGVIRVFVFLTYIVIIGMNDDIKRVFQYHGAEHMAVNAHEAGEDLHPENVQKYGVLHARCGTSFLLMVMIMSILVFSVIPKEWPLIEKFISRIVLIPLIAGMSYEFVKYSSKRLNNPFIRAVAVPGLWLQKLTTGRPSMDQVEVAIRALQEVLSESGEHWGKERSGDVA